MAARSRGLGITSKDMVGIIQISVSWYCWCVVLAHKGLLCRTGGLPAGVCLREGLKTTQVSFITKAAPQAQHLPVLPPLMRPPWLCLLFTGKWPSLCQTATRWTSF
jgi:hypothetical protein